MEKECSGWKGVKTQKGGGGVGTSIRHSRVGIKLMTLLNFWIKLTQKGISELKNENYHRIFHIQINLGSKFQLQQTIWIFGKNLKKYILLVENTKK